MLRIRFVFAGNVKASPVDLSLMGKRPSCEHASRRPMDLKRSTGEIVALALGGGGVHDFESATQGNRQVSADNVAFCVGYCEEGFYALVEESSASQESRGSSGSSGPASAGSEPPPQPWARAPTPSPPQKTTVSMTPLCRGTCSLAPETPTTPPRRRAARKELPPTPPRRQPGGQESMHRYGKGWRRGHVHDDPCLWRPTFVNVCGESQRYDKRLTRLGIDR